MPSQTTHLLCSKLCEHTCALHSFTNILVFTRLMSDNYATPPISTPPPSPSPCCAETVVSKLSDSQSILSSCPQALVVFTAVLQYLFYHARVVSSYLLSRVVSSYLLSRVVSSYLLSRAVSSYLLSRVVSSHLLSSQLFDHTRYVHSRTTYLLYTALCLYSCPIRRGTNTSAGHRCTNTPVLLRATRTRMLYPELCQYTCCIEG